MPVSKKAAKKAVAKKPAVKKAVVKVQTKKKAPAKKAAAEAKPKVMKPSPRVEQSDLLSVFNEVKKKLAVYSPPFHPRLNIEGRYDLWMDKNLIIDGRQRSELYFGAAIIQSSYVGFYLMSVYMSPEVLKLIPEKLLKTLKGKSCFHIKKLDDELLKQIEFALKKSFEFYKKMGWI
jgi:hypothetical protein